VTRTADIFCPRSLLASASAALFSCATLDLSTDFFSRSAVSFAYHTPAALLFLHTHQLVYYKLHKCVIVQLTSRSRLSLSSLAASSCFLFSSFSLSFCCSFYKTLDTCYINTCSISATFNAKSLSGGYQTCHQCSHTLLYLLHNIELVTHLNSNRYAT
jgi:hypothetical protein